MIWIIFWVVESVLGLCFLIEEDHETKYYSFFLKYFLAEGVACSHGIALVTEDEPSEILDRLPAISQPRERDDESESSSINNSKTNIKNDSRETKKEPTEKIGEDLKIAWRYKEFVKSAEANQNALELTTFCHTFDFSKRMRVEVMNPMHTHKMHISPLISDAYLHTYQQLNELITKYNSSNKPSSLRQQPSVNMQENLPQILRIVIQSYSSPLWNKSNEQSPLQTLHALRGLLRSSLSCCFVSFPAYLHTPSFTSKVEHLSDYAISLESFNGKPPNAFSEYDGFLVIKKLSRVNSLTPAVIPDTLRMVFKLTRKKLIIEKIHLGPEESRTASQEEGKKHNIGSLCSPSAKSVIDF